MESGNRADVKAQSTLIQKKCFECKKENGKSFAFFALHTYILKNYKPKGKSCKNSSRNILTPFP